MKYYFLDSTFDFGQYKGKTLEYVANENAMYIEWCIKNVESFLINYYVAEAIRKIYPRFLSDDKGKRFLLDKLNNYSEYLNNEAQNNYKESETNWNNEYYDDSLDIDQQDPEWWDSL